MKYQLAIDYGAKKSFSQRYKPLDLDLLSLNFNNNFKDLCQFTMAFSSLSELKAYLIAHNLLSPNTLINDIVITYNYQNHFRVLRSPFACDKPYFDFSSLSLNISQILKTNPSFINQLAFHSQMPPEYYILKNNLHKKLIYTEVLNFVKAYLGYPKINYRALYDLAILISLFLNPERSTLIYAPKLSETQPSKSTLTKKLTPSDLQLKLF